MEKSKYYNRLIFVDSPVENIKILLTNQACIHEVVYNDDSFATFYEYDEETKTMERAPDKLYDFENIFTKCEEDDEYSGAEKIVPMFENQIKTE